LTRAPRNYAFLPNIAAQRVDLIARISNQNFRSEELELIPPAKTSFSLRAGAKGSAAYISNNDNTADIFATASMSYGAGGIFTDASYSNEDRLTRLNTLFFAHQFREHRLQIGTIEQINSDFLLNQRLIGTRWSRSFNTVIDKQALFTTPIEVELPIRSIVQLVVDGVVRSSEELDAGLQIVDASNLPEGTYNLEIRIRDATNGLRVINQIYTRSRILPPVNHTTYGFIAGKTRNNDIDNQLPEPDENNYFSSTISTRLGNQSGATLTASQFNDSGTAELALSRIGNRYQLQISGIVGKHSALGSALKAGFNGKSLGVSIHGMMFESDRDLTGDLELRRFLLPDTQRGGIGLNWRHKRYSLSLRADRQRTTVDQETETRNQFSTTLSRRLGSVQGNNRISVRFADDEDTQRVELKLTLQAKDNNLNHGLRLSYGKVNNQDWEPQIAYNAVFEPGSADGFPDATRWIGGFETTARESRSTLGVSALVVNPFFDLGLRTSVTDEQSDELTWRTLVSASSQIVSDGGAPVMGRFSRQSAGVIVDVAGEPGGENFDIVVNGQRRGVGQIGTRQFISLSDYHTHKIELIPRSIVFNGFDKPLDPFTLYPGNVSRIELSAANNYLLITKLVDRAGNILSDVIIRNGDNNYFVLNDGVVQIEVKSLQVLDVDLGDGEVCSFEAPDPQGEDIVFSTAPLLCLS